MNRWVRRLLGMTLFLGLGAAQAFAVALGNIKVTSHLGEPFHAEVPLELEPDEQIAGIFVDLASPSEYRILEVYRDPALNAIRTDIKADAAGARVVLSSDSAIEAPYFNLILKVRHGHATHFKKFPVFLDLPEARSVPSEARPAVSAVKPAAGAEERPAAIAPAAPTPAEKPAPRGFTPFDGWARIGRYGPMVYGDTISTVARRLRIDDRYTMAQVVMALFFKNRSKFDHDNVNLIKAGTYLDVPKAKEVEAISPARARQLLAEHNRVWEELKKQPRYAAVAEAQKNRYKARVRVGKTASGVAEAPLPARSQAGKQGVGRPAGREAPHAPSSGAGAKPAQDKSLAEVAAARAQLRQLKQQNAELKQKLKAAQDKAAAMSAKLASPEVAAANARIRKLELRLARLQAELERQKKAKASGQAAGWMTYALAGLVIVLLAVIGYLLSRMRRMSEPATLINAPAEELAPAGEAAATSEPEEEGGIDEQAAKAGEFDETGVDETQTLAAQQTAAEADEASVTDSVPELTESDTAEMEPFQEPMEEEPDPNVDYLAEADVYMRYGMEDEAIHQLRLAIKQRPDNAEAHARLVQALKARGDADGAGKAMAAARAALSGEALQAFEEALAASESSDREGDGDQAGDALPATGIETIDLEEAGESAGESAESASADDKARETDKEVSGEEAAADELDFAPSAEREAGAEAGPETAEAGAETEMEETAGSLDIGDELEAIMGSESEDAERASVTVPEEAAGQETVDETAEDMTETEIEVGTETESEVAGSESPEMPVSELDLSDAEMPDIEAKEESSTPSVDVDLSDLEKTVAIDWSADAGTLDELVGGPDTEPARDAASESGAVGPVGEEAQETQEVDASGGGSAPTEETATPSGMLDIDLDDIDLEVAQETHEDAEPDDFTSTVQLTVSAADATDAGGEPGLESAESEAPPGLEISLDDLELDEERSEPEPHDDSEEEEVDLGPELDTLLPELELEGPELTLDALDVDKAKSLLAEGRLDEAESLFRSAASGGSRGQGLLGLAELAIRRGDLDQARQLLEEAASLVDDVSREWFESLKQQADAR